MTCRLADRCLKHWEFKMQSATLKKMEIIDKISRLPEGKINELNTYLQGLFVQLNIDEPKAINLEGVWKNKGFEKIVDLDSELKTVRKELSDIVLKKEF